MIDSKINKRDYLRLKYNNMQLYLISNCCMFSCAYYVFVLIVLTYVIVRVV